MAPKPIPAKPVSAARVSVSRVTVSAALALLALAACAPFSLVAPGKAVQVRDALTVEPGVAWNRVENVAGTAPGPFEAWTIDGPGLHGLAFHTVKDGEALYRQPDDASRRLPTFRKGMSVDEVAELYEASLTRSAETSVFRYTAIRPQAVDGRDGFRLEFSFTAKDGIDRDGVAVGAVVGDRLVLVVHQGTHLHHAPRHKAEVERLLGSIRLSPRSA